MDASTKSDVDERGVAVRTRRVRTFEEKLAILKEAAVPGASVAAVARKYGMNANLLFGWRRLHQRGLLESQRHAPAVPLLPVKITTPTMTPTASAGDLESRKRSGGSASPKPMTESYVELVLADGMRLRLYGEAQRVVLDRVLARFARR